MSCFPHTKLVFYCDSRTKFDSMVGLLFILSYIFQCFMVRIGIMIFLLICWSGCFLFNILICIRNLPENLSVVCRTSFLKFILRCLWLSRSLIFKNATPLCIIVQRWRTFTVIYHIYCYIYVFNQAAEVEIFCLILKPNLSI